jgi:hypothetical protein
MAAAALCGLAGSGAVAFAATSGDTVENVSAAIVFEHAWIKDRTCPAPDGSTFLEQFVHAHGTATGDPRLSGAVDVHLRLWATLENAPGIQEGTLRIRDADSGVWKLRTRFSIAAGGTGLDYVGGISGTVTGRSGDAGRTLRARLTGPFDIEFHDNGAVTAQVGGQSSGAETPAALYSGACEGPFDRSEVDLPAPDAPAPTAGARGAGRAGWR